jgi:hypothetical protein
MIRRRAFITLLGGAATWPFAARAQQPGKAYRIGLFYAGSEPPSELRSAIPDALRELGWIEGKNVIFERRYAENRLERLHEFAAELVRLDVDVIVANARAPCSQAGYHNDPHRHDNRRGSVGDWACCQSGTARRQRHGNEPHGAGRRREAAGIAQRASATGLTRGRAVECG